MTRTLPILLLVALAATAQPLPPLPQSEPMPEPTANNVTLAWDASPDAAQVKGYTLYLGTMTTNGPWSQPYGMTTNLTITATNLTIGQKYYFAVTATGTNNLESDLSNVVVYTVPAPVAPPASVGVIKSIILHVEIEGADGAGGPWVKLGDIPVVVNQSKPHGVFRAKMRTETVEGVQW